MKTTFLATLFSIFFLLSTITHAVAQDTVRVSLPEFIERGLDRSGQTDYLYNEVDLANNRVEQARNQRFLPRIELSTQHGVIPGVVSQEDLSPGQYYLDPNLSNDWEDWAIFTRAELSAVQPIYTWGAIDNAIEAATLGAQAAEFRFEAERKEIEIQLYELYYSYQLAEEMNRILGDAESQMRQVERQLREMEEEGDPDLKQSDIFKFELFQAEFVVQRVEVEQSLQSIRRIWNYAMGGDATVVYIPEQNFIEAVPFELEPYDYYETFAMESRAELKGADAGIAATQRSIDATKAQNYPALFLGITGSYANTPNRPRQTNPFIINSTNYASAAVGLSIRQNLNFRSNRNSVERARIENRRVQNLKDALTDGIILELNERYREALVAQTRVTQLEEKLTISRNWVRQEQLDYDFGFGEVDDLIESVQNELETRVELKQNVFELNKRVATLYKAAGIPISQLGIN
ncbi:TolC family protein [Rhodohalobacter sp. SW132]|uniref:TolC family protein n=1 Tax=Rhodohalobacter sp. SW132 TaxID=2293433 RepID=UPI000E265351|nr:TolC family protein [Rhodohalobacter sp. SW132]REL33308.1 TolC family protein [Rhodohalobacter sp. SW132]